MGLNLGSLGTALGAGLGALFALPTGGLSVAGGAAIGGSIGGGLGGAFDASSSAKEINRQQQELAESQMAFQERMSSTAHQREVADLKAAGLNPVLSANSGASSPSGAMAVLRNPADSRYDALSKVVSSASAINQARLVNEQVKTQKEQTGLIRTNTNLQFFNAAEAAANARIAELVKPDKSRPSKPALNADG